MRAVFLLGSGISVDAGMPNVATITGQVFGGAGVVRHSDATYYMAGEGSPNYDWYRAAAEPAIAFAGRLRVLADNYFSDFLDGRTADYEDVANLAKQVEDALSGEYENPALLPLIRELRKEIDDLQGLLERASETRNYIRDIVWRMLNRMPTGFDHLTVIVEGCRALASTDLFELNHDRVLELALAAAELPVSDGFTRASGDVLFWTDEFDRPLRHLKLHGSITWFHRDLEEAPWRGVVVARSLTHDPYHERDAAGKLLEFPADGRPVLLTGTFDKPLAYDSTVYADQHYRFHESLREADAVIVIGYGFRDKAINSRLIGWLHNERGRRLIITHGNIGDLVREARPAIARNWNTWINDGRLRVVEKWVAEVSWADVEALLPGV
jgi:SIR2-like domain